MIQPLEFSMAIGSKLEHIDQLTPGQIKTEYKALPKELKQATTAVIYRGNSPMNGDQIMCVVSGIKTKSQNDKTGVMAQASILLANMHPVEGYKTGADEAICGECPLRLNEGSRICYVNVLFNNGSQFKSVTRNEVFMTPRQLAIILAYRQRGIRWGSYGDPAMLPFGLIHQVMSLSGVHHTSYTHQWIQPWFDKRHLVYSMASIDHVNTVEMLMELQDENTRYYRLVDSYENLLPGEIKCPSNSDSRKEDGSRKITCAECGLCAGSNKQAKSIAIIEE